MTDGPGQDLRARMDHLREVNARVNGAAHIFDDPRTPTQGGKAQPLAGLIFSAKESFSIAGEPITLGSPALPPQYPTQTASYVERAESLGARLVARGNLSEFMLSYETDNLVYGRTANPLNRRRTAGGSSGGDAALVAAGAVDFALASDIGGSIRIPAAFCGVVGLRAASATVDASGFFPRVDHFAESMMGLGHLAPTVAASRRLNELLSGQTMENSTGVLRVIPLSPFARGLGDGPIGAALRAAVEFLRNDKRAEIRLEHPKISGEFVMHWMMLLLDAYGPEIRSGLRHGSEPFSLLREVVNRVRGRPTVTFPTLLQLLAMKVVRPSPRAMQRYVERVRAARGWHQDATARAVYLLPTTKVLAPPHGRMNRRTNLGMLGAVSPAIFCNAMDLTALTVPAPAFSDRKSGLIPGVTIAAGPGAEALVYEVAEKLESAFRVSPRNAHSSLKP